MPPVFRKNVSQGRLFLGGKNGLRSPAVETDPRQSRSPQRLVAAAIIEDKDAIAVQEPWTVLPQSRARSAPFDERRRSIENRDRVDAFKRHKQIVGIQPIMSRRYSFANLSDGVQMERVIRIDIRRFYVRGAL